MKKSTQIKGNFLILGTAFLWSFIGIVTKAVSYNGMTVTGITSFMALVLLLVYNRRHKWHPTPVAVWAGVLTAVMNICFFMAN